MINIFSFLYYLWTFLFFNYSFFVFIFCFYWFLFIIFFFGRRILLIIIILRWILSYLNTFCSFRFLLLWLLFLQYFLFFFYLSFLFFCQKLLLLCSFLHQLNIFVISTILKYLSFSNSIKVFLYFNFPSLFALLNNLCFLYLSFFFFLQLYLLWNLI